MDPKTYPEWQASLLKQLVATTRAASAIGGHDIMFERSIDSEFDSSLMTVTERLLSITNRLLMFGGLQGEEFEDEDDLEDRWGDIVDVVDTLLERADTCVDEFSGATSKGKETITPTVGRVTKTGKGRERLEFNIYHANIPRPQLKFKTPPDNVEGSLWRPILKEKPHAIMPLDQSLSAHETSEEGVDSLPNPYEHEIIKHDSPQHIRNLDGEPIQPVPLEENDVIWVADSKSFRAMLNDLKEANEIAVDLEHHDYRSYHGFVCLMQISTRKQDWIVDTLELREELNALNEVFTDPNIVKVFHGATSDVAWLQRDFGLYLVSLFDTYHASNILQFPSKSLAYLLLKYVNIEADKKYQLADWRIRPLPSEMLAYARSDTHYLLYIYDRLRRDIHTRSTQLNRDLLTDVLDASRKTALITYRRERYDFETGSGVDGWQRLLNNNRLTPLHSTLQVTVLKRLHRWRDQIAREEDESVNYVLPNRSLMNLAASLPHSMQGVVAACHPVPPLVQVYAEDIAYIVQKTRKELAEEAAKAESTAANMITGKAEQVKNGVTGSMHVWYKEEATAPTGVKSAMEAVKHGSQFDLWGDQKDKVHSLIITTSSFWEPLQRDNVVANSMYDIGGGLEDIKLSVPLPPLTAQIYMTAEDVNALKEEEKEDAEDNVASLAEHPFVQRAKVEQNPKPSEDKLAEKDQDSDVIIARKLKKKAKKREREDREDASDSQVNGEPIVVPGEDTKTVQTKTKNKRRKGLKEKVEASTMANPVEQFDPYKIDDTNMHSPAKVIKNKGSGVGKSMTFVSKK